MVSTSSELKNGIRLRPRRRRRPNQRQDHRESCEVVPGWFVHRLRVTDPAQLDDQVQRWIAESYRLMGMRERLTKETCPLPEQPSR